MQAASKLPGFRVEKPGSARSNLDPVIDLVHLARQTDGDSLLESELLAMFDRQSAKTIARIGSAEISNRARADLAHRLRGSALAIGAGRVAKAAENLEKAAETAPEGTREPASFVDELAAAVEEARSSIAALQG